MTQGFFTVAQVNAMIKNGDKLLLAGDAPLLSQLSKGNWIGGSCSRFVEKGKTLATTREKIFVHNITNIAANIKISIYDAKNISNIYDDAYDNGFSVLIMPFFSDVWSEYGVNCSNYSNFANRAVCGWVAVTPLYSDYEKNDESLVFSGESGQSYTNAAIVMHIGLSANNYAEIHVFTPFKPSDEDVITFEENGQQFEFAYINGVKQSFREYLISRNIDRSVDAGAGSRKCLAGDYAGFIMNVAIAHESEADAEKYVSFAAPIYKDVPYRIANMDSMSYEEEKKYFDDRVVCSFTCITNSGHPEIFNKNLTQMNGPFTYGEIAYFLLNHATVYVTVGQLS